LIFNKKYVVELKFAMLFNMVLNFAWGGMNENPTDSAGRWGAIQHVHDRFPWPSNVPYRTYSHVELNLSALSFLFYHLRHMVYRHEVVRPSSWKQFYRLHSPMESVFRIMMVARRSTKTVLGPRMMLATYWRLNTDRPCL
jgi:hypothetical protein